MFYTDMSNDEYHSRHDAISNSGLNNIEVSPSYYKWRLSNPLVNDSLKIGTLLHTLLLEPNEFDNEFTFYPDFGNKRTNARKQQYAEWEEQNAHKTWLKKEEYEKAMKMRDSVYNNHFAAKLLDQEGQVEYSFFDKDPETGVDIRWRPDKMLDSGIMIDLKTTNDANPLVFGKSVYNFGYHKQAAFYVDNTKAHEGFEYIKHHVIIACENKEPFNVVVFILDDDALNLGREKIRENLDKYAYCLENDFWPSYGYDFDAMKYKPVKLNLPGWAYNK